MLFPAALLAAIAVAVMAPGTPARAEGMRVVDKHTTITACSSYGRHGCYTAKLRHTPLGPQMRLKGGTWIWCESDCRDTLRRATIDFWDDQRESAP